MTSVASVLSTLLLLPAAGAEYLNRFPQLTPAPDYNIIDAHAARPPHVLGNVTGVKRLSRNAFEVSSGYDILRVEFYRHDVVRLHLAWAGHFTDPATADLVVGKVDAGLTGNFSDEGTYYKFWAGSADGVAIHIGKAPLRLSAHRQGTELWAEAAGITVNATATFQTLSSPEGVQYFGGGMQNGRWIHSGQKLRISTDFNWNDGGNPNAAPFFLSSSGFGVFRNTWSPGFYDFTADPIVLAHNETRFDAFFLAAAPGDLKALIEGYSFVTGRPFMPPIYAFGLGDSDCYHNARHGNNTLVALAVADEYRSRDLPGAWILPNDGYGCGFGRGPETFPSDFSILDETVAALRSRGFVTGLWSSTGLPNISREVAGSGTRVAKTDVGWIGNGYKFAFDAVSEVAAGIENNSDARRFIWTVEGWAGTQRLAVMWTGDNSGSFNYIRWQIPTFIGAGLSAQAHVSGDVDGIFGGSPETYVRDLQMKCFMTVMMTMSGWAANPDKQPWTWGEPYTSINRMYLKIKMSLTPYVYSLAREAYESGVPPVRAMALEFPEDANTWVNSTGTSQQFMSGPFLLVAPVFAPRAETSVREGIYLPPGTWVDFWSGERISGARTLDGYPVPLEKLPVFVRAGAVIPLWPSMHYPGELSASTLTLDIFPSGNSSFEVYEDDGVTREALEGNAFVKTVITSSASADALHRGGRVVLRVGVSYEGDFKGKLQKRAYIFQVHIPKPPLDVFLNTSEGLATLAKRASHSELSFAESGWFFDASTMGGTVFVKTSSLPTATSFAVTLSDGPHYPRIALCPCAGGANQSFMYDQGSGTIEHEGSCMSVGIHQDLKSGTPAIELQPCGSGRQEWLLNTTTGNLHPRDNIAQCVDVDGADHMAEVYSCNHPLSPNQRFKFIPDGSGEGHHSGTFTTWGGSCMTVVSSTQKAMEDSSKLSAERLTQSLYI